MTGWARTAGYAILGAGALVAAVDVLTNNEHDFAGRCELCHTTADVTPGGPASLREASVIAGQCQQCHRVQPGTSHPVGMIVKAKLPEIFPLDESGRMTCLTCHRAHQPAKGEPLPSFLRRGTAGIELCSQCHAQAHEVAKRDQHALGFAAAHDKAEPATGTTVMGLDERSMACMSCHDDFGIGGQGGSNHPIGVPYPVGAGPRRDYHPKSRLPPAIRLFDGNLGCETCHSLYSNMDNYLVMSNRGSALCLTCHDK
ncbi:MAG: hypothetical protein HQ592_06305 [Planctomycetes bacterium]|nr:hypothetical protein [Planctomycetota bacterium]